MTTTNVFVIDDDHAVRDSLNLLFRTERMHCRAYASAEEFLQKWDPAERGCIVTDVRMPGMDGMQLLQQVKHRGLNLPVVVITGHADVPLAVEAMKSGAADFIEKPFESHLLLRAVRAALESLDQHAEVDAIRALVQQRLESLSRRESQVLQLMIEGKPNRLMGETLGISPRTVEIYRANVMAKMQAESLSELVRMSLLVADAA